MKHPFLFLQTFSSNLAQILGFRCLWSGQRVRCQDLAVPGLARIQARLPTPGMATMWQLNEKEATGHCMLIGT